MEKTNGQHWADLTRRDLLKMGVAAGVLASLPPFGHFRPPKEAEARVIGSLYEVVTGPTLEELSAIAKRYYMNLSLEELKVFQSLTEGVLGSYRRVAQLPEPKLPVKYPRTPGYRPSAKENPYGAWYWRCSVKGAPTGKLAGKKIALKDNICLAGIPMMNGSSIVEGYMPDVDATVVTRILEASGEIIGKAVNEDLCFSGGSHTSATGPVRNPHNPKYMTGGSSSGSAVVVVTGEADMAMGGDQGGSIRIPSSWTGAYGLKATYGLVPYTGVFPIENTLDHTGPMAANVRNVALLLEVIAGKDPLDPRQGEVRTEEYTKALTGSVGDLKIGVVSEGFGWPGLSEEDVDKAVRGGAGTFRGLGATVRDISIPIHRDGIHIWNAIAIEGAAAQMVLHESHGLNWKGYYNTGLIDYYGRARRTLADNFSDTTKLVILLGQYMMDKYVGRYYGKALNLGRVLRDAYDEALKEVDLLLMPTTPMKAMLLIEKPTTAQYFTMALGMIHNTCPFDVTGHPAMNVPCAKSQGLPVGMMLIGRHFEDAKVLRAAEAFERTGVYR